MGRWGWGRRAGRGNHDHIDCMKKFIFNKKEHNGIFFSSSADNQHNGKGPSYSPAKTPAFTATALSRQSGGRIKGQNESQWLDWTCEPSCVNLCWSSRNSRVGSAWHGHPGYPPALPKELSSSHPSELQCDILEPYCLTTPQAITISAPPSSGNNRLKTLVHTISETPQCAVVLRLVGNS